MLQRLAQFGVALLDLFEQANVLNGYHGLGGKGLEKRDLLVRERAEPLCDGSMMAPTGVPSRSSGTASESGTNSLGAHRACLISA